MKVLVCTDGSEHSQKTVREAAKMVADMKDAEVTVFNVAEHNHITAIGHPPKNLHRQLSEWKQEEGERILAKAEKVFIEEGIKVNKAFREGHPARAIVKFAADENYDLVVIGDKGHGGIGKLRVCKINCAFVLSS